MKKRIDQIKTGRDRQTSLFGFSSAAVKQSLSISLRTSKAEFGHDIIKKEWGEFDWKKS